MPDFFSFSDAADLLTELREIAARELRDAARFLDPCTTNAAPPRERLVAMIPHVTHELVAMLNARQQWDADHSWIALERSLLHLKIVADFFWPHDHAPDVIHAGHYLPDWHDTRPALLTGHADAIGGLTSQLSTRRVTDPVSLELPVSELADAVWQGWTRFLSALGPGEYASSFRWHMAERAHQWHTVMPNVS